KLDHHLGDRVIALGERCGLLIEQQLHDLLFFFEHRFLVHQLGNHLATSFEQDACLYFPRWFIGHVKSARQAGSLGADKDSPAVRAVALAAPRRPSMYCKCLQSCYITVMNRSAQLVVRITPAERRAFEEHASLIGLSISAWARMVLLRQIRMDQKKEL